MSCPTSATSRHPQLATYSLYRLLKPGGQFAIIQPTQTDQAENERWRWLFDLTKTCFPPGFVPPLAWRAPNPLRERSLLEPLFQNAGFEDIRFADDSVKLYWADEDDWWQWEWSQGSRFWLEGMTPEALERFKTESFRHLQDMKEPDGIPHVFTALYAAGRKTA